MPNPMVVGVDPAATRLAMVAQHPLLPIFASAKYALGKRYEPACAGEAMDVTLGFLEGIRPMATGQTPLIAWIEAPTGGRPGKANVQSMAKQAFISGVVQACLIKSGYQVYLVPPATWKGAVVGRGNASKDEVVRTVAGRWPKLSRTIGRDYDLNDAACICTYGMEVALRAARGLV